MTGDMGELFNDYRAVRKEKRAANRENGLKLLQEAGIAFEVKNGGAHLVVEGRYDYWPGTGLWMCRGDKTKRRGVHRLIERIRLASCSDTSGRKA